MQKSLANTAATELQNISSETASLLS